MTVTTRDVVAERALQEGFENISEAIHGTENRKFSKYGLPVSFCRNTVLAKSIQNELGEFSSILIWLRERDVWECESSSLAEAVSEYFGISRADIESPLVIESGDISKIDALLSFAIYSMWGCLILPLGAKTSISISHDSVISICGEGSFFETMARCLHELDLELVYVVK